MLNELHITISLPDVTESRGCSLGGDFILLIALNIHKWQEEIEWFPGIITRIIHETFTILQKYTNSSRKIKYLSLKYESTDRKIYPNQSSDIALNVHSHLHSVF